MNLTIKIITSLLIIFSASLVNVHYSHADCEGEGNSPGCAVTPTTLPDPDYVAPVSTKRTVEVIVTEDMPGLDCEQAVRQVSDRPRDAIPIPGRYICQVPVGMEGALLLLGRMIRWLTAFALICAVLFLVFNGMRLTTAGVDPEAKGKVKTQIFMTLGGIILLLLSGPILRLIAPWVYR